MVKASVMAVFLLLSVPGSLSRSYVMLVLSELRKGGYVTIEKGKLVSMTSLPEKL
ncbi:helix-turn-helix domain-containing protein [Jinshanibacter sp. LJY008]|uniref:Helix-turn-helix domain-containing protein n=2 Tax=Limnobaculum eriocheiris TaxID=2897391 RepID=A0A9X1SK96_9GAMM|nr:helix-turn-helix domain-containing protein [Limnobaculum eriocheiris]